MSFVEASPGEGEIGCAVSPPARRPLPLLVLEAMRPRQWVKNVFVLAGVVFAGRIAQPTDVAAGVAAFVAFCLVSGATYLLNDASDAETDRLNPRTARRAVARGDLGVGAAYAAALFTGVLGLGIALAVNGPTFAAVGAYLLLQLAYSRGLKHVLFVDVMVIAFGFVLRALAGTLAVEVVPSEWLLLCTGLLALFLGLAKRRGEAVAMGGESSPQRPVLDYYSVALLDELIAVVTPATVVVYALYAALGARSSLMLLTVPFVLYGIFRVLFVIHHHAGQAEDPSLLAIKDRPLLTCVLLWALVSAVITLVAF